jgi:phosphoribosylglycinamide formyltransferase-1
LNEQNNKIRTEIFSKEELNESKVLQKLKSIGPDLIVLWIFIEISAKYYCFHPNKIINIHSITAQVWGKGMYGMNVHKAVVE